MKTVVSTSQVAHLWANQSQEHARNSQKNFYFRGPILFSYRDSFPLRVLTPWRMPTGARVIIARDDIPSNTTRRHESEAWSACRGHDVRVIEAGATGYADRESWLYTFGETEARAMAAGDLDALAAIVAHLVKRANACAESALRRADRDNAAYDYRTAAGYLETARDLARANGRGAKRSILARINRDAPALPDMANADASRYSQDDAERKRGEAFSRVAGEFAKAKRAELRDAKRAAELRDALKAATSASASARKVRGAGAGARHAWHSQAADAWRKAETVARKIKRPAAERKTYAARAAEHDASAERLAHLVALERVGALADNFARYVRTLRGIMAKGRRENDYRREAASAPRLIRERVRIVRRDEMPRAWEGSHRDRAFKIRNACEAFALILESHDARAYASSLVGAGFEYRDDAHALAIVRERAATDANAARALADIIAANADALRESRNACQVFERRGAMLAIREYRPEEIAEARAERVNVGNAEHVAQMTGALLARVKRLREAFGGDAAGILARYGFNVPELERAKASAELIAQVSRKLSRLRGSYPANAPSAILSTLEHARGALAEGHALRAETFAVNADRARVNALKIAEESTRLIAEEIAAPAFATLPEDVRNAWHDAAAHFRDAAPALERAAQSVADVLRDCMAAANAARANVADHWRRTGEKAPGFESYLHGGNVAFRRGARGVIVSSLGAEVSEAAGRRLWALIRACVAADRARTWPHGEGPHVGSFRLHEIRRDGSAVVGCHNISGHEARAFAEYMQWPPFGAATDADALATEDANA